MLTITRSTMLCAFSFAVFFTSAALARKASAELIEITGAQSSGESEESQEEIVGEDRTFYPQQQQWPVDSSSIEIYTVTEAFAQPHAEFVTEFGTTEQSTMFQESIFPDFTPQEWELPTVSDNPNAIFLKDVGYNGPGDMRTHLWRDHATDLESNGISQETLMSMPLESVQKWHNYFHGTETAPDSSEPNSKRH